MQGARVVERYSKDLGVGTVVDYRPLGSAMCDCLVEFDGSGYRCWFSSNGLERIDGGTIPDRQKLLRQADEDALRSLLVTRERHIAAWSKPWPGAEFGKSIVGSSIDGAIAEIKYRLGRK